MRFYECTCLSITALSTLAPIAIAAALPMDIQKPLHASSQEPSVKPAIEIPRPYKGLSAQVDLECLPTYKEKMAFLSSIASQEAQLIASQRIPHSSSPCGVQVTLITTSEETTTLGVIISDNKTNIIGKRDAKLITDTATQEINSQLKQPLKVTPSKVQNYPVIRFEYDGNTWVSTPSDMYEAEYAPCMVTFDGLNQQTIYCQFLC